MKRILVIFAILGALWWVTTPPANAHNFDSNSLYTCSQEEPPNGTPTSTWVTRHSHPVALTSTYVDYSCYAWDGAREVRYFATRWWNGATNAHGGYRYGPIGIGLLLIMGTILSDANAAQLHRLAVDYQWREYHRRVALRDTRRAEVHQLLGFTDAPYQPVKRAHQPSPRRPGHAVGRGGRRKTSETGRNTDHGLRQGAPWKFG